MQNQDNTNEYSEDYRQSIWSVPAKWRAMYFILFTLFAGVGLIMVISLQEIPPSDGRWNRLVVDIMREMAFVSTGSAGTAITITEIARYIMVIGEWMLREVIEPRRRRQIERWRQEGIQEGRAEGIEQGIEQGIVAGRQEGIEQGIEQGIVAGRQEGIEQGIEKGIDRGRSEGIQEGRAEANKEWESWISRKMQADANGETFDEPMPTQRNGTG